MVAGRGGANPDVVDLASAQSQRCTVGPVAQSGGRALWLLAQSERSERSGGQTDPGCGASTVVPPITMPRGSPSSCTTVAVKYRSAGVDRTGVTRSRTRDQSA